MFVPVSSRVAMVTSTVTKSLVFNDTSTQWSFCDEAVKTTDSFNLPEMIFQLTGIKSVILIKIAQRRAH